MDVSDNLVTVSNQLGEIQTNATDGLLKGWICFNGSDGQVSIMDSYNVTSLTRHASGHYTVTWDVNFANTAYSVSGFGRIFEKPYEVLIGFGMSGQTVGTTSFFTRNQAGTTKDVWPGHISATGDQ